MSQKMVGQTILPLAFAILLVGGVAALAQTNAQNGTLQKSPDEWRSSKLVGSSVYNDQGTSIGTVDDMLIGSDGKISNAVVSVGAFLGMGSKLVDRT
jgi:hypothetical protein